MALLPFRQAGERFLLILALTHFDQRKLRDAPSLGWLHPRRLARLLAVVRRPGGVTHSFFLLARRELQQLLQRSSMLVDLRVAIPDLRESFGHGAECEISGVRSPHFIPIERSRDARIRDGPD